MMPDDHGALNDDPRALTEAGMKRSSTSSHAIIDLSEDHVLIITNPQDTMTEMILTTVVLEDTKMTDHEAQHETEMIHMSVVLEDTDMSVHEAHHRTHHDTEALTPLTDPMLRKEAADPKADETASPKAT